MMTDQTDQADIIERPETNPVNYNQTMAQVSNDDDPETNETAETLDLFCDKDIPKSALKIQYNLYERKNPLKESYVEYRAKVFKTADPLLQALSDWRVQNLVKTPQNHH